MANNDQSIVIKKVKKGGHGHHGGAWKIAYADFVTAMMAFFMLLWILASTTEEQKKGIAEYFSPPNISESTSGAGGVMGGTDMSSEGAKMTGAASDTTMNVSNTTEDAEFGLKDPARGQESGQEDTEANNLQASETQLNSSFDQQFHSAATSIRQAWRAMPDITKIADNLLVEETPEGLNIQIMDQAGRPMFPEGSKYPYELTRKAIAVIAPILQQLPNQITISGHTAAGGKYPNPNYGSWELSSDRANVVRSILGEFGLSNDHVQTVAGQATAEPFFPNDPYLAANERVKIVVLHEPPPVPPDLGP